MDVTQALTNAARILDNAETETNLALLAELKGLADSWIAIADVLTHQNVT